MNYGIALFIYDRPQCTEKVLESLRKNSIEELYVFQDGLGESTNQSGWEKNIDLIKKVNWCKVHYFLNDNKASSLDIQIIYGINKVFEVKEEVIVIEDDCVISQDCIPFFLKCFDTYRQNKKVMSIDAYLEPITIPRNYKMSVIAAGAPSCWGWGTWKDRWEELQRDFSTIKQIGDSIKDYATFNTCGYPIKKILTDYWLLGTWDLWWSIFVLIKEGISIRPTYNRVHNIGFENPGTHTEGKSPWVVPISNKKNTFTDFPYDIEIEPWAEEEFKKFYQSVNESVSAVERQTYYRNCLEKWMKLKQQGKSIGDTLLLQNVKKIVIYGTGTIGELLVNDLVEKVEIEYFILTNKTADNFMGYSVYSCNTEFPEGSEELSLIVIPGYEIEKIMKAVGRKFSKVYSIHSLFD